MELLYGDSLNDGRLEKMFENIIGYDYIKKELNLIIDWYMNDEFVNNKNAKLPSGIMFHGNPGNGKTLFIKELVSKFKDSAFIIDGDEENILDEITSTYEKARKKNVALVLIDEIDLLVEKDSKVTRVLQDELDGINKQNERILTIATTNSLYCIPEPLLRCGRFDRSIFIGSPEYDDRKKILEYYFKKLNLKTQFKDMDEVVRYLGRLSCAEIMTLCNDCYFRFHDEVIDEAKLAKSLSRIDQYATILDDAPDKRSKSVAYHEIGHALMTNKYKDYFHLLEVRFTDCGGICKRDIIPDSYRDLNFELKDVEIALGGIAVEELFFGCKSLGSNDDLERARTKINDLVNTYSFKSVKNILQSYNNYDRMETHKTRYKNEKIANRLLEKCYKRTYKYLKAHKKEIILYGDMLIEKGRLVASDFKM